MRLFSYNVNVGVKSKVVRFLGWFLGGRRIRNLKCENYYKFPPRAGLCLFTGNSNSGVGDILEFV